MKPATWTSYEDRLNRVTGYIYDHLDDDLNMETLAGVAALSPFHWHRIYSAMRGETVTATVKRLRLLRAGGDLAQTQRPIAEVATRAGYSSVSAFTRAFSDAYGMPPAGYRDAGSHKDFQPGRLDAPRASWTIDVKALPLLRLLSISHKGAYMDIGRAFETGMTHATGQKLMPERIRMLGVYYDDPTLTPEAGLRSRAALIVDRSLTPAAPLEMVDLPARSYAVLRYQGPYSDMRAAYLWMFGTWLPQSGREAADAPVLEEYLNNPRDTPPSELLTDLFLPLE
jgi:AraC family transcriptional regulator